jgi:hypothetical protein
MRGNGGGFGKAGLDDQTVFQADAEGTLGRERRQRKDDVVD